MQPQPGQPGHRGHLQQRGMQHLEQQTAQGQQQQPGLQHPLQQPVPQQPFSGSCGHGKGGELG